jgi:hypothetical protein
MFRQVFLRPEEHWLAGAWLAAGSMAAESAARRED